MEMFVPVLSVNVQSLSGFQHYSERKQMNLNFICQFVTTVKLSILLLSQPTHSFIGCVEVSS